MTVLLLTPALPAALAQDADTTPPALANAEFDKTYVFLTYDEALDELSLPSATDFDVTFDDVAATVVDVDVDGMVVVLELDEDVSAATTVTVDYTAGTSPVQNLVGLDAANLVAEAATAADFPPFLLYIEFDGTLVRLTYDETLGGADAPAAAAFSVFDGSTERVPTAVAKSGATIDLTLASALDDAADVTVDYAQADAATPIQDAGANLAADIVAEEAFFEDLTAPALVAAYFDSQNVLLVFDEELDTTSISGAGAFGVYDSADTAFPIGSVVPDREKLRLKVASGNAYSGITLVEYTSAAADVPLQDAAGNAVADISQATLLQDSTPPSFNSAQFDKAWMWLTYGCCLDETSIPDVADFAVSTDGGPVDVVGVDVVYGGSTVLIELDADISTATGVQVDYTSGDVRLQDSAENAAADLADQAASKTNFAPYLLAIEFDGTLVRLTYDETLGGDAEPPATAFSVSDGTTVQVPSSVAKGTSTIDLTLPTPLADTATVTVDYSWPEDNGLSIQDLDGAMADELVAEAAVFAGVADPATTTVSGLVTLLEATTADVRIWYALDAVTAVSEPLTPNADGAYPFSIELEAGTYAVAAFIDEDDDGAYDMASGDVAGEPSGYAALDGCSDIVVDALPLSLDITIPTAYAECGGADGGGEGEGSVPPVEDLVSVTGRVLAFGEPASGVDVDFGTAEATTGADGTFGVSVAAGDYTVFLSDEARDRYNDVAVTVTAETPNVGDLVLVDFTGGTLVGTITDGTTAVSGATIWVSMTYDETAFEGADSEEDFVFFDDTSAYSSYGFAVTEADGSFIVTDLADGTYDLFVDPPEDSAFSSVARFEAFAITDAANLQQVTLDPPVVLEAGGWIEGTITDADGLPVEGAWVDAWSIDGDGWGYAESDANGYYKVEGLSAGTYNLWIQPEDDDLAAVGVWDDVVVAAGAGVTKDVTLAAGSTVVGLVVDADGEPVEGAWVGAWSEAGSWGGAETDEDGEFEIEGLLAGPHTLDVFPPFDSNLASVSVEVDLAEGENEVDDIVLGAGVSITGVVTGGGAPLEDVFVYAHSENGWAFDETDETGAFTLGGLSPGTYEVVVWPFDVDGSYGTTYLEDVEVGEDGTDLGTIALANAGAIVGTVVDGADAPVADAWVWAIDESTGTFGWGQADGDGAFEIRVGAGTYTVYAEPEDDGSGLVGGLVPGVVVTEGADAAPVVLTFTEGITLTGRVTDGAEGLAGAEISVWGLFGHGEASTAVDGTFTITGLVADDYDCYVEAPNGLADRFIEGCAVDLAADTNLGDIVLGSPGSIAGTVTGPDALPLSDAEVFVWSTNGEGGEAETAADGTYAIDGLPAGTYTVVVEHDDHGVLFADDVVVAADATTTQDFAFAADGSALTGSVTVNGAPTARVQVVAVGKDADGNVVRTASTLTTADGAFAFANLPDATYTVTAIAGATEADKASKTVVIAGADADAGVLAIGGA